MNPREPLQAMIDPFIRGVGGELVADLLCKQSNLPQNADYLFRQDGIIAELNALEKNSFGESFRTKMGDLTGCWDRRGLLRTYGTRRIDLAQLPPMCQREFLT